MRQYRENNPGGYELDPATYGFTEDDYDHEIFLNGQLGLEKATLREILAYPKEHILWHIGFEYGHIHEPEQRHGCVSILNKPCETGAFAEDKEELLGSLTEVEGFEQFIHVKFIGTKRFSVEGGDAANPCSKTNY